MDDLELLDLCLSITGTFENGKPEYDGLSGDFDGEGMSAGILQWNAGSGTLQALAREIGGAMGWEKAKSFFSSDIEAFSRLGPTAGVAFVKARYLADGSKRLSPAAEAAWRAFLSTPESAAAQQRLAVQGVLSHAKGLAALYVPAWAASTRSVAFFFDLATQEGSMLRVEPTDRADPSAALACASRWNAALAEEWAAVASADPKASALLYYAYARASLARIEYVWDSLARRGAIACRVGEVNRSRVDFRALLD